MGWMRRAVLIALLVPALYGQSKAILPDTPGRALVLRVCTKCHEAETFAGLRMSREEWKFEVDGMIARGAKANRQEARKIVDYLVKNLGAGHDGGPRRDYRGHSLRVSAARGCSCAAGRSCAAETATAKRVGRRGGSTPIERCREVRGGCERRPRRRIGAKRAPAIARDRRGRARARGCDVRTDGQLGSLGTQGRAVTTMSGVSSFLSTLWHPLDSP